MENIEVCSIGGNSRKRGLYGFGKFFKSVMLYTFFFWDGGFCDYKFGLGRVGCLL